jgi:hypothetical protein
MGRIPSALLLQQGGLGGASDVQAVMLNKRSKTIPFFMTLPFSKA